MRIENLIEQTRKPELFEPGNSVMWTDPYISKQILDIHLNGDIDLGSRKPVTISKTVNWIISQCQGKKLSILDLGCGPGLYSELFATKGHRVTGVDFSESSIRHAKMQAKIKNLDINYLVEDYTKLNLEENEFDMVLLIFTDFGPLLPEMRHQLLEKVHHVLKPGGLFIFDVLNDNNIENKVSPKSWEVTEKGFWSERPCLLLSESYLYKDEKVVLYQHTVIEDNTSRVYRFWNQFFSNADLGRILEDHCFEDISFHQNIIPSGDGYESSDVTFCIAVNS